MKDDRSPVERARLADELRWLRRDVHRETARRVLLATRINDDNGLPESWFAPLRDEYRRDDNFSCREIIINLIGDPIKTRESGAA